MLLKLDEESKYVIKQINVSTRIPEKTILEVFEAMFRLTIENYLEGTVNEEWIGNPIRIPYLGDLKVEYEGDHREQGLKVANLKVAFSESEQLNSSIGNIEDGETSFIVEKLLSKTEQSILEKTS